jgi:DNA-binding NtrC family response regulator
MPDKDKRRVLFLEDEPIISKVVTRILAADGFEVDVANNGQVAKDKINSGTGYDLFIFDIKTPIINGIQLYEYLEKDHPELTEKVIIATGDSLNDTTKKFLERVNRPFLAKPYTLAQIKTTVHQVLGE